MTNGTGIAASPILACRSLPGNSWRLPVPDAPGTSPVTPVVRTVKPVRRPAHGFKVENELVAVTLTERPDV